MTDNPQGRAFNVNDYVWVKAIVLHVQAIVGHIASHLPDVDARQRILSSQQTNTLLAPVMVDTADVDVADRAGNIGLRELPAERNIVGVQSNGIVIAADVDERRQIDLITVAVDVKAIHIAGERCIGMDRADWLRRKHLAAVRHPIGEPASIPNVKVDLQHIYAREAHASQPNAVNADVILVGCVAV